jgi:hypothetical protein
LSPSTRKINLFISFKEALKLNLAIQERLRAINKFKQSTNEGKRAPANRVVDFDVKNIAVMPDTLAKKNK